MSELQTRFEQAQIDLKSLSERPDNATLLELYALYKQATAGDVSGERPGMMDFINRAKYDAWERMRGLLGRRSWPSTTRVDSGATLCKKAVV